MADTRTYRWSSIGGHLALDLCNTVSWRLDPARTVERLATAPDLVDWFRTVAAPAETVTVRILDHPEAADRALRAVHELRDSTIRVIDAHLAAEPAAVADAAQLSTAWRRALAVA